MCVPTFGHLRIKAYLQLPEAFRSLSRPSSAPDAKAFSICSSSLELPSVYLFDIRLFSFFLLELLCLSYIFLQLLELSLLGKICFVLPASFSEKPDFCIHYSFSYSSLSCTLIRFSMSIPKPDYFLFIKLYSYLTSFSQIPVKLHEPFLWAQVDSNHRPRAYQARALTS